MKTVIPFCLVCCLAIAAFGQDGDRIKLIGEKTLENKEPSKTTEIFRVSKVGVRNAQESRELLMNFYDEIEANYNTKLARQASQKSVNYRGNRVRVLKVLDEKEDGVPLYVMAYEGRPSVFAIKNGDYRSGDVTPPLQIAENGQHETMITREIVEKTKNSPPNPGLEKASKGGGVTFFGIPIDFDDEGGAAPEPEPEPEVVVTETRRLVTEVQTMPKYVATISEEKTGEAPPKFSQQLFLEQVKNGTVYTLNRAEERRCQTCRGFRRVMAIPGKTGATTDGKMSCPECLEAGKIKWDVTYKVAW